MAARNALLKHLRVNTGTPPQNPNLLSLSSFNVLLQRCFSIEVRGSFIGKSEVAVRVITVVKNFQKGYPSKAAPESLLLARFGQRLPGGNPLTCVVLYSEMDSILHFMKFLRVWT